MICAGAHTAPATLSLLLYGGGKQSRRGSQISITIFYRPFRV